MIFFINFRVPIKRFQKMLLLLYLNFASVFGEVVSQSTDSPSGKMEEAQGVDELNERRAQLNKGQTLFGCGVIAFRINMNHSNSWRAFKEPVLPLFSKIGYGKFRENPNQNVLQEINYDEDNYCPPGKCNLPHGYDARTDHPECPSIRIPLDEGCNCRAGWAVSAASAFTDRLCISTNGSFRDILSAQDLLSCCIFCSRGPGCEGGDATFAWIYFRDVGLVTGSYYGTGVGCKPYRIKPCSAGSDNIGDIVSTPSCKSSCQSSRGLRAGRRYTTANAYNLKGAGVTAIKREIMFHGPVTAEIKVFEDLHCYQSGIYHHEVGDFLGFKSIKLIGWGEDYAAGPYWIAVNTWGDSWGEGGFFKIKMGVDESNVELSISGGMVFPTGRRKRY